MLYLYEHMGKPLKRLPQPPLKGPRGERLVLRSSSHCFCNKRQQYSFYNKDIASQDAMGFLRDINGQMVDFPNYSEYRWKWPAVVLMPEEYKLRVGGMSVTGLRQQLENYWGQGGILGAAVEAGYVSGRYYSKFFLYHLVSKDIRGSYNNSVPISG